MIKSRRWKRKKIAYFKTMLIFFSFHSKMVSIISKQPSILFSVTYSKVFYISFHNIPGSEMIPRDAIKRSIELESAEDNLIFISRGKGWEELALLARKLAESGHDQARQTCLFSPKSIADSEASLMGCFSLLHQMINHEGCKKNLSNMRTLSNSLSQTTADKSVHGQKRFQKFKTQHESNLPLFNNRVNYPTHVHDITYSHREKVFVANEIASVIEGNLSISPYCNRETVACRRPSHSSSNYSWRWICGSQYEEFQN